MSWMDCVKSMKSAIAAKNPTYSQTKTMTVSVDGKTYTVRTDCSGYVSAALEMFGAFGKNYRTNSTGFSHDATVASKLKAAGFTKKAFTSWTNLKEGCIISDDYAHVEIFAYNQGGAHYVYSNGSTTSMRSKVPTKDGGTHTYDTVWFPPTSDAKKATTSTSNTYIKKGQEAAKKFIGKSVTCDGIRNDATKKVAVMVLQTAINKDYNAKLTVNGTFDANTKKALGTHYVTKGEKQYMVTAAEILMYLLGKNPNGVEYPGTYGSGLVSASGKSKITASDFISYLN